MVIFETAVGESLQSIVEREGYVLSDPSLIFILPDIPAVNQAQRLFYKFGLWGERLLTFGKLASLANLRSEKKFIELSRMGRLFLMEEVIRDLSKGFLYFRGMANIKGFSQAVVRVVAELKQMKLTPDRLSQIAESMKGEGQLKNKLKDLGTIFNYYQRKPDEEGLIDDIDRLRILSECIGRGELANIIPDAGTFVVFGFYDFTHSQLEVLKGIDEAGYGLLVYLPNLRECPTLRTEVIGRMDEWLGEFEIKEVPYTHMPQTDIKILSFPSFREETEFSVREIKRLIVEGSFKPDDICVILRSIAEKGNYLIRGFEKLGVPYSMSGGLSIGVSPFGQFITNLLKAKSENFERKLFVNLLRSPYITGFFSKIDNFEELISELDLKSRNRRILRGLADWKSVIKEMSDAEFRRRVEYVLDTLETRFNSKNLGKLNGDLAEVLDELLVYKAVETLSAKSYIHRLVWERFSEFLREITFLTGIRFKRDIGSLGEFISLLGELLYEQNFPASAPTKTEKVLILDAFDALGTMFPVVFILDVGEKSFPSAFVRDPILKNDERALINSYLGRDYFRVEKSHFDSEEFLFKSVSSSAAAKLYITYSYLDEKERSKLPSYLVEEIAENEKVDVKRCNLEDGLLSQDSICTRGDLVRHLFYTKRYDNENFADYLSDNWNPYRWVSGGIRAESSRLAPDGVYCCYEGIITKKGLLADLI
ncbi:MAG TPA: hypothetical protein VHT73_07400, partial [Thermodesulfobacteriota bacterium]|nr:hypothetical protein [Thermodesulfobacteriota bacterium]